MELLHVKIPSWADLQWWLPEVVLCVTFLAALVGDLMARGRRPGVPFAISVLGLVVAGVLAVVDRRRMPRGRPRDHGRPGRGRRPGRLSSACCSSSPAW